MVLGLTLRKLTPFYECQAPTSVEELQRLNGFVNYLAKFLPQLATIMEPIRKLTRKDTPWEWLAEQQQAFDTVKKFVTESPVLSYYNPEEELQVQCDARIGMVWDLPSFRKANLSPMPAAL